MYLHNDANNVISLKLYWEGIGDIVVCTTILHGIAEQHPDKEVRFYVKGSNDELASQWVAWAKLGWENSFDSYHTPLEGTVYELGNPEDPNNDPELIPGNQTQRHILWAGKCETIPRHFRYNISLGSKERARKLLESIGLDLSRPIIYFSPVTKAKDRNWPLSHWHKLEEDLTSSRDVQILIGTSVYQDWATRKDFQSFRSSYFLGSQQPDILVAVMMMMSCIVSNDSGFAHIGGIMSIPTVAICGPYDGEIVFGWYGGVRVAQSDSRNIEDVEVQTVHNILKEIFRTDES